MNRLNQILIVILALQFALGAVIFWPRTVSSEGGSGPLLVDFTAADVVSLIISDQEGNRVDLAKTGDEWVLPKAGDYPADGGKITPVLDKIEGIKTSRLVTQTDASHKRLKVAGDEFNRLLEITLKDGSTHKLFLGSSAGAGATHVRADGQSEVYLTSELASWEVSPQASAWIDTLYFSVPQTTTVAMTLENQNGKFEFEKAGESWTMKGLAGDETFNEANLTTLLNQATSVRLTDPLGKEEQPSYGLDQPLAVVTLKTRDGDREETHVLRIGAKSEEGNNFFAGSSDSPYYVQVSEFTGNNFVAKTRDDFIQPPPTPESGAESNDTSNTQ